MRVAIYGRSFSPDSAELFTELFELLDMHGATIAIEEGFYRKLTDHLSFSSSAWIFNTGESLSDRVDFMLSIGGDGTMLDTVTIVRDTGIPVLGINIGRLGFLSGVARDQLKSAIISLKEKKFVINKRSLIHVESGKPYFGNMNFALNELSVHRKESPSLIAIKVWVNSMFVNAYWADGLIVCTPTGSTGYSLSCGGPIIYPQADTFLITPIATHNLTVRPLVIPDSNSVTIAVDARYGHYTAGLDARYSDIAPGDTLTVTREAFYLNIIQFEDEEFFSTIREKLKWGLDTRN